MEDIMAILSILLYFGSAVYFAAITVKLFQVRKTFIPLLLLISPSVAVLASMGSNGIQLNIDNALHATIISVIIATAAQLALEIIKNTGSQFDEAPAKAMLQIMEEDTGYHLHE